MATHRQRIFHQKLCESYTAEEARMVLGDAAALHPLAQRMLEDTCPYFVRNDANNKRYENFIRVLKEACDSMDMPTNADLLKKIITPTDLHNYMQCFARGVQYAAHKTSTDGGCHARNYEFAYELKNPYGKPFREFSASYNKGLQTITINPLELLEWKHPNKHKNEMSDPVNPQRRSYEHGVSGFFNPDEIAILTAVEEMYHSYQVARNPHAQPAYYSASEGGTEIDSEAYRKCPVEAEAKQFIELAARELRLGSDFGNHAPKRVFVAQH